MYTTRIKRFARQFKISNPLKFADNEDIKFNKMIFKHLREKNKIEISDALQIYIDNLSYNKNNFIDIEKKYIKESIREIFSKKIYLNKPIKENSSSIKIISLSGFGYSGTGAINDFLRDTNYCLDVLEGRELDFLKYEFSMCSLYKKSLSKKINLSEDDLYKFFFNHILGLPYPNGANFDEINNRLVGSKAILKAILRLPCDRYRIDLVKDISLFIKQIFYIPINGNYKNQLEIISKNLINNFGKYYKSKYPEKKYIILNNWIPASNIKMVNLLPKKTKLIVCTRNGLDSYYSWANECPRIKFNTKLLIIPFLFLYYLRHIDYKKNYKLIPKEISKKINFIYFEDFILKTLNKNGKLFFLNLFGLEINDDFKFNKFNPFESKRNINIFKKNTRNKLFRYLFLRINYFLNLIINKENI